MPPLLRNSGPVRTLEGESCSKRSVSNTRNTHLIQYGTRGVHVSIMMHAPIFAMYVGPMKVKEIKLTASNLLISCFYSFDQAKCWGVRLTIKTI